MARSTKATAETAKLQRGFGRLAALGVLLVLAGLVGLVYTGVATLTSSACCTRSRRATPTSSASARSSRRSTSRPVWW